MKVKRAKLKRFIRQHLSSTSSDCKWCPVIGCTLHKYENMPKSHSLCSYIILGYLERTDETNNHVDDNYKEEVL